MRLLTEIPEATMFTVNRDADKKVYLKLCKARQKGLYTVFDYATQKLITMSAQIMVSPVIREPDPVFDEGGPWYAEHVEKEMMLRGIG